MQTVRFRRWEFRCDPSETRRFYNAIAKRLSDLGGVACSCVRCRNFFAARDQGHGFPAEVVSLLDTLGINSRCESELLTPGMQDDGVLVYDAYFPFVGDRIDRPRDAYRPGSPPGPQAIEMNYYEPLNDSCSIGFSDEATFVHEEFGRRPVLEAVVALKIPWILNEPES